MFLDEIKISVKAGNGGHGCVSFYRERFMPKGGPDGGDGGRGGDVIFRVDEGLNTLYHLKFQRKYAAKNGEPGKGSNRAGKKGEDLILSVPPGTQIRDAENQELIVDFSGDITEWSMLEGGKGGRGNDHFKTSVNRTPREAERGEEGPSLDLLLSLKVIADVGLLGLPNAGKSSLVSCLTRAKPKIADYPFTTLTPHLGSYVFSDGKQIIFADIPGLIEGASTGKGLGIQFLKHIERTRLLIHLVEPMPMDGASPPDSVRALRKELEGYSSELASKRSILVLSKSDLNPDPDDIRAWEEDLGEKFVVISTATHDGIDNLLRRITSELEELDAESCES